VILGVGGTSTFESDCIRLQQVVEDYSSIIGEAAETHYTLFADHGSMCKFRGRDDDNYERVLAKIRAYLTYIATERVPSRLVDPGQQQARGGSEYILTHLTIPRLVPPMVSRLFRFVLTCWLS
jgi:hypothetical protein